MLRHPSSFAGFTMLHDAARAELLVDRAEAGLLVTVGDTHHITKVAELPRFIPSGSVVVLNTSGTFFARFMARMPSGDQKVIHFAQMLDDSACNWIVVIPEGLSAGQIIGLEGDNWLQLQRPYLVGDVHTSWEDWGTLWLATYHGEMDFDSYQATFGQPIRYGYDHTPWTLEAMQNCFATRRTSAMMNNGGRNLTPTVLGMLQANGVHLATLEMRTGVGVDQNGIPLPEFVRIDEANTALINHAIDAGRPIIPAGTGVIRALDWFYEPDLGGIIQGEGWCTNVITPETGTWVRAWISGMHEPDSTHLAMGAAIMSERVMLNAMLTARDAGLMFHENGDTHLYLPV